MGQAGQQASVVAAQAAQIQLQRPHLQCTSLHINKGRASLTQVHCNLQQAGGTGGLTSCITVT
jgi:hypothetical protein